ncbi:MAG: hypothetical protein IJE67_07020 [Peptococcaceae bacterium]|nr:hypothetical protein [Peptococcaceae bacterium]
MSTATKKFNPFLILNWAIVLFMCFVFPNLSPLGALSENGMALVGCFLGAVWGWSTISMEGPSFIALFCMGWYLGFDTIAGAAFGNVTVISLMFMFILLGCISETGAVNWLVTKLFSFKFFVGKPWVTIAFFFYVSFFLAGFNSVIMAVVLITIIKSVCETLKLEPFSKLPTFFVIGNMYSLLMGQVVFPFHGVPFIMVSTYSAMYQTPIDFVKFIMLSLPLGLIMVLVFTLAMRFIFRVDATPFKDFDASILGENKAMTKDQKKAFAIFFIFILCLLASCTTALGPVYQFLNKIGVMGIAFLFMFLVLFMKTENGKPFIHLSAPTPWGIVLITATVMIISKFMMSPDYGITATIGMMIKPLLVLSDYVLIVVILAIAVLITHVATNMIVSIVMMPFVVTAAMQIGIDPTALVVLLFFTCQMSIATPGGGAPISAMFYGISDWVKVSTTSKYAALMVPILLICDIVIGLAWANLIF